MIESFQGAEQNAHGCQSWPYVFSSLGEALQPDYNSVVKCRQKGRIPQVSSNLQQSAYCRSALSLMAAGIEPVSVRTILDLPCGHGRVLRHLSEAFPDADITACGTKRSGTIIDSIAHQINHHDIYACRSEASEQSDSAWKFVKRKLRKRLGK